jgi:hypothetical protein
MARSRNTADTQTASGGPVSPNIAGKNKIINGDFSVWQRGTSFSSPSDDTYSSADRWKVSRDGSPTFTVSQQAATPVLHLLGLAKELKMCEHSLVKP